MARIIRNGSVVDDPWIVVEVPAGGATPSLPDGPLLLPLALWQALWQSRFDELQARQAQQGWPTAVWLAPQDDPAALSAVLQRLTLVAVHFPKATDGRGYSTAALLRQRYGYRGELRAIGQVLRDQLHYLRRSGFDAFALRADQDPQAALASLRVFDEAYQPAFDQPLPLFRRRAGADHFNGRTA